MVASGVASKGLDFAEIQHVINFTMPQEIENYVHQIGRTGRSGKTGIATTFINMNTPEPTLLDLKYLLLEAKQRIPPFLQTLEDPNAGIAADGGCQFCGGALLPGSPSLPTNLTSLHGSRSRPYGSQLSEERRRPTAHPGRSPRWRRARWWRLLIASCTSYSVRRLLQFQRRAGHTRSRGYEICSNNTAQDDCVLRFAKDASDCAIDNETNWTKGTYCALGGRREVRFDHVAVNPDSVEAGGIWVAVVAGDLEDHRAEGYAQLADDRVDREGLDESGRRGNV